MRLRLAETFGVTREQVWLREQATVPRVTNASLAQYRVIAFATHALVAGDFPQLAEPALVLTPPQEATADDDGLLRASRIAQLQLDAEWVLLSCCNTAAGETAVLEDGADGPEPRAGAEGLSGLAKAFFYAGARTLLVSHWVVETQSAMRLTNGTLEALTRNPELGKARALQRAMLALLDDDTADHLAHPAFWAPFVVVGEGGAPSAD